ncbi:hypothetical protein QYM36_015477 [Artemia franciscana]|uniref:EF-hand domain-containing protein n=1 Tax=Artemia franciscana TaxID=6661 RepID=A0AA88H989_ARTSF|nr:hypothetical protein QYM36_015477 [Artemia franciscana]
MPEDDGDEDDGELSINSSVRDVFKQISGEDSEVDWQELQQALDIVMKQEFDFEGFSKDTCRSMIAMLDVDHSGRLGYEEFRKLWSNIVTLKGIFKEYDADESGTLSTMELRSALAAAGYRVNFKILNALVLRYGNKQGSLSFDDYLMCAIKLKNMIGLVFSVYQKDGNILSWKYYQLLGLVFTVYQKDGNILSWKYYQLLGLVFSVYQKDGNILSWKYYQLLGLVFTVYQKDGNILSWKYYQLLGLVFSVYQKDGNILSWKYYQLLGLLFFLKIFNIRLGVLTWTFGR